jgi:hypothetical protein
VNTNLLITESQIPLQEERAAATITVNVVTHRDEAPQLQTLLQ